MSILLSIISILSMIMIPLGAYELKESCGMSFIVEPLMIIGFLLSQGFYMIGIIFLKVDFYTLWYYKILFNVLLAITVFFLAKYIIEKKRWENS